IREAPSGNIIFAGFTKVSNDMFGGDTQMFIYSSSSSGDSLWSWMSNSLNSESISSIELINDTTLLFLGSDGSYSTWFRKINLNTHTVFFEKKFNNSSASGILKKATDSTYVLVNRTSHPDGHLYSQTSFLRADSVLNHIDTVSFGKIDNTTHSGLHVCIKHPDNTYFIATSSLKKDDEDDSDILLLYLNYEGDTLWTRTYSSNNKWDYSKDACLCDDGGYAILGLYDGTAHIIKTDEMGMSQVPVPTKYDSEEHIQSGMVYPNPVSDKLYFSDVENVPYCIDIYSRAGTKMKSIRNINRNNAIDFSAFKPGVYWLIVYMEPGRKIIKVIKK
ncbi:MAG: T9SS type A sorting domain-containing protein, partial [Bacteroidales bacterium]